ncbi:HEPN domain-containing protein [Hydrogenophaga sp. NH-16]|uniref:HEPN domain-containing protein n=1 Tax=Hydrogenophaga sp. NH-16 TaxID=2184519 RepID=UPI000FDB23BC|nr:HEPN domain-containing protein [Hydrogenophaga sp. NH-16]
MFRVEYLITVDQKDAFCTTTTAFNNLLKTIDGVSVSKADLRFESLVLGYELQTGEVLSDKQRYFHAKLTLHHVDDLPRFESLLKSIRSLLHKASGKPAQTLWDGVSLHYAQLAYPLIHDLENTMRKLITKFMLTNVGVGWANETVPREVVESVRSKTARPDHNYLYEVDFIQLSNFLFKEYTTVSMVVLTDRIKKATKITDLAIDDLKLAIPRSNWDRYFSTLVQCEGEYLKIRWDKLYEKRNLIAHNRPVFRVDFEEISTLCTELSPKLQQALDSLDKITVADDDRELVSESAAFSKSANYGEFLVFWNRLHQQLYLLASLIVTKEQEQKKLAQFQNNIRAILNLLTKRYEVISRSDRAEILDFFRLRNVVVHQTDVIVPGDTLSRKMESMSRITSIIQSTIRKIETTGAPVEVRSEVDLEEDEIADAASASSARLAPPRENT